MSRRFIYPLLIIGVTVGLFYLEKYVDDNKISIDLTNTDATEGKAIALENWMPTSNSGVVIHHDYFTLSYAEAHEQAEWVAYELSKSHLSKNDFERPYFIEDEKIRTGSANWRNYKNSGYDRGHLCPAGDRRFSYEAFKETFLTSNISPQNHEFNGRVWNYLEQKVRFWANKYNGVYVVTGGVLEPNLKTIGEEQVSIPKSFYKIVYDYERGNHKVLAFLIPNKPTTRSFYDFVTTVDAIEAKTGIDFFPHLSPSEEKDLESQIDLQAWGKR